MGVEVKNEEAKGEEGDSNIVADSVMQTADATPFRNKHRK